MKSLFEKMFTNTSEKARKMMYVIYCVILATVIVVDVIAIVTESLASGVSGFIIALVSAGIYTALVIIGIWMSFIMYFVFLNMSDDIKIIRKYIVNVPTKMAKSGKTVLNESIDKKITKKKLEE